VSNPVARLAAQAVNERSREALLEAFVAAARFGESLELPFAAAEELGLRAAALVDEAVDHLSPDEEEALREFAEQRERIER
jgi:hypothetical protein